MTLEMRCTGRPRGINLGGGFDALHDNQRGKARSKLNDILKAITSFSRSSDNMNERLIDFDDIEVNQLEKSRRRKANSEVVQCNAATKAAHLCDHVRAE